LPFTGNFAEHLELAVDATAHAVALAAEVIDPVLNMLHVEGYAHGISVFDLCRSGLCRQFLVLLEKSHRRIP
jgi:hypothetical protein